MNSTSVSWRICGRLKPSRAHSEDRRAQPFYANPFYLWIRRRLDYRKWECRCRRELVNDPQGEGSWHSTQASSPRVNRCHSSIRMHPPLFLAFQSPFDTPGCTGTPKAAFLTLSVWDPIAIAPCLVALNPILAPAKTHLAPRHSLKPFGHVLGKGFAYLGCYVGADVLTDCV